MNRIHLSIILIIYSYCSICLPDYLSQEQITSGVVYFHEYHSAGPRHIHIFEWDVYQGINLDGGGSSTMVIQGEVDSSGYFRADSLAARGFIYVQRGVMIDSAKISVTHDVINRR